MVRIGYFVPEFPGQTHIFFWRERQGLLARGLQPDWLSTRRPPGAIVSHAWARDAMRETVYLHPPQPRAALGAAVELVRANPAGWLRCLRSIERSEAKDASSKAKLAALALVGAELVHLSRVRGWQHIHVHSCAQGAQVALFSRLLGGPTYSLTLHGPLKDYGPNQKEKWRHAKFAIVITKKLEQECASELSGSLPPIVEVAPMGVETEHFVRRMPYKSWDGSGPLRVFSCGRLNPCKGHGDLIAAIGMLRARGVDARLEIAGEDEVGGQGFHRTLADEITSAKLQDAVTLLGAVSEERVRSGLEQAHVFALASLAEPLGVAIMEAMAVGVPVVVTGAGGVAELVRGGIDGLLVPPSDASALAGELERLARDGELAERLAQSARERVIQHFDSARSVDAIARNVGTGA